MKTKVKKKDVKLLNYYVAKVSGQLTVVCLDEVLFKSPPTSPLVHAGWKGTNMLTNRRVRIKSARKLRLDLGAVFPSLATDVVVESSPKVVEAFNLIAIDLLEETVRLIAGRDWSQSKDGGCLVPSEWLGMVDHLRIRIEKHLYGPKLQPVKEEGTSGSTGAGQGGGEPGTVVAEAGD